MPRRVHSTNAIQSECEKVAPVSTLPAGVPALPAIRTPTCTARVSTTAAAAAPPRGVRLKGGLVVHHEERSVRDGMPWVESFLSLRLSDEFQLTLRSLVV
jgi:hypothetical protein